MINEKSADAIWSKTDMINKTVLMLLVQKYHNWYAPKVNT